MSQHYGQSELRDKLIHFKGIPLHISRDEYYALIELLEKRQNLAAKDMVVRFLEREKKDRETQSHTDE